MGGMYRARHLGDAGRILANILHALYSVDRNLEGTGDRDSVNNTTDLLNRSAQELRKAVEGKKRRIDAMGTTARKTNNKPTEDGPDGDE